MTTQASGGRLEPHDAGEFKKLLDEGAQVEKLAGGFGFLEGPVWTNRDGGYLIFSDIPRHELNRWSEKDGATNFRAPSNNNGNTRDAQGTLITAEHDGRRVTRTGADGKIEVIVERFEGKKLNSPNDVVVKRDGTIWFTDPPYGLPNKTEGKELDKNYVFRFDPKSGQLTTLVDDFDMPNGLAFSPDEKILYIADSGKPAHIRAFDVRDDGTIAKDRVFCTLDKGIPDGFRCDTDGRVWTSAGDGVHVYATNGSLVGKIITPDAPGRFDQSKIGPEVPANVCFGGQGWSTLYITACTSLYRIETKVKGAGILWD